MSSPRWMRVRREGEEAVEKSRADFAEAVLFALEWPDAAGGIGSVVRASFEYHRAMHGSMVKTSAALEAATKRTKKGGAR